MVQVQPQFTNLQLELLKVFSRQVPDDDVKAIRKMLVNYFAEKAMNLADQAWDKNGWTEKDTIKLSNEHYRISHI
jgi:hypothetical protein